MIKHRKKNARNTAPLFLNPMNIFRPLRRSTEIWSPLCRAVRHSLRRPSIWMRHWSAAGKTRLFDTTVVVFESLDGQQRFFTVNGKTDGGTTSVHYYISSLSADAPLFAQAARDQWASKTSLIGPFDGSFREDDSHVRIGHV